MYQLTVSGNSDDLNLILFICDILKQEEVTTGSENLSYFMDKLLDYFGHDPLVVASYGLEKIDNFRDAIEKMRQFVEAFDRAAEIPEGKAIAERQKRRGLNAS